MSTEEERFLQRLLAMFRIEAQEHLQTMSSLMLELDVAVRAEDGSEVLQPLIETLFREAHSLKGAARSVNLETIELICRSLESVLSALRKNQMPLTGPVHRAVSDAVVGLENVLSSEPIDRPLDLASIKLIGALDQLLTPPEDLGLPLPPVESLALAPLGLQVEPVMPVPPLPDPLPAVAPAVVAPTVAAPEAAAPQAVPDAAAGRAPIASAHDFHPRHQEMGDTVRVSSGRLGVLLNELESLLGLKQEAAHRVASIRALHDEVSTWRRDRARAVLGLRVAARQQNTDSSGELARWLEVNTQDELFGKQLQDKLAHMEHAARQQQRATASLVDQLLDDVKQVLLQPAAVLLDLVPRLARDLGVSTGKQVDVLLEGQSIEIDRRILEQLKDPLIHLVRNAIDHGLEAPEQRRSLGKPERGQLRISVAPYDGGKVLLCIEDDGAGIALQRIREVALAQGRYTAAQLDAMDTATLRNLIFETGFSTSPILTDLSGHGLGLAIVREKVEKLGGHLLLQAPAAGGTRFEMLLPATLATFRGVLVSAGERQFVLPTRHVERVLRLPASAVGSMGSKPSTRIGDEAIAVVRLSETLGLSGAAAAPLNDWLNVAVVAASGRRIAFVVDAVLADIEVLVKGLGPQLRHVRNIAGATLLEGGQVVPVLNAAELIASAAASAGSSLRPADPDAPAQQSLLVAEDSITSRSLLKGILEANGYKVTTAVDGLDALTQARAGQFDLVVSDVEMPRMDGFDLTARLRAEARTAATPVILVTALDSREHKERGVEAGANAYIVKSAFDQTSLLAAIRRLI
ncbi:hypothetical protein JCM19000A_12920 [Silvimonas sp. JCM 19000]